MGALGELCLLEVIEDVWSHAPWDAIAGVADTADAAAAPAALEPHAHGAAPRSEFGGVAQEVPHDLLQAVRIAKDDAGVAAQALVELNPLRLESGSEAFERHFDDLAQIGLFTSMRVLPLTMPLTSSTSLTICDRARTLRTMSAPP